MLHHIATMETAGAHGAFSRAPSHRSPYPYELLLQPLRNTTLCSKRESWVAHGMQSSTGPSPHTSRHSLPTTSAKLGTRNGASTHCGASASTCLKIGRSRRLYRVTDRNGSTLMQHEVIDCVHSMGIYTASHVISHRLPFFLLGRAFLVFLFSRSCRLLRI